MRPPDTLPSAARTTVPAPAWQKTYPGLPAQARIVRADLRPLLAGCPAADDVLLLTSELAANAIAHSHSGRPGGIFTVRLTHQPGSGVQAEVADQGSTWPGDLPICAQPPHGLYLLQALSTACGTRRDGHSHIVWFRLDHCCGPAPVLPPPLRRRAAPRRRRSAAVTGDRPDWTTNASQGKAFFFRTDPGACRPPSMTATSVCAPPS